MSTTRLRGCPHSCATLATLSTSALIPSRMSASSHHAERRSISGLTRVMAMRGLLRQTSNDGSASRLSGRRPDFTGRPLRYLDCARRRPLSTLILFTLMQSHGPKRFYTPHSLEFWFGRLEDDWSLAFTPSQLEEGRRLYRAGEVRELELTESHAVVHRRIDKKDEYAVIEWNPDGLSERSSTTSRELAHALAVAGLHEIEELVADEISPLPGELPPGSGHAPSGHEPDGRARAGKDAGGGRPDRSARPLLLVFKIRVTGLAFRAFW